MCEASDLALHHRSGNETTVKRFSPVLALVLAIASAPDGLALAQLVTLAGSEALADGASIDPANMPRIAAVDNRFQSYNIEMVEVTGGRFWKPYGEHPALRAAIYSHIGRRSI